MEPATESLRSFEQAYLTGLLALEHKSLLEMSSKGFLPHSHGHSASLLASEASPHRSGLARRLSNAPPGGVLAVDLLSVKHEGTEVQGTGRVYSSSDKGVVWGHGFLSSALVFEQQDPYPLQLAPFATEDMATPTYPCLTATEGMLTAVGDVYEAGYQIKVVSFDAQFRSKILLLTPHEGLRIFDLKFTTRFGLRSLKFLPTPFVGRCRTDLWVTHGKEKVQVCALAEHYPPGKSRYYKRFGWYAKRLEVWLGEVGYVDLILIWKAKGTGWECFVLLSTLKTGVQDILQTWKLRWDLEVSHRLYKQNLGLGKCRCRRYASQLKHADSRWKTRHPSRHGIRRIFHLDLVLDAFLEVREQRLHYSESSWRKAQEQVAVTRRNAVLTASPALRRKQGLWGRDFMGYHNVLMIVLLSPTINLFSGIFEA